MNIFKKLLIGSTIISFASPVISQVNVNQKLTPKDDKKILEKEILIAENDFQSNKNDTLKITVTGTRSPRAVDTFPGSINVLDQTDLESKSGFDTREIMKDIPGVTTQLQRRTGIKGTPDTGNNVNIRGLDKNRVLFLLDGIRLPNYHYGSATLPPDYYNMNQATFINWETLSAVEILKGPASALYGSDALGGIISLRSLKANDILPEGEDFKVEIPVNYDSSNEGLSESIKLATKLNDNIGALIIYTREDSNELNVKTESKYQDKETHESNNYFINITNNFDDFSESSIIFEKIDKDLKVTSTTDNLATMTTSRGTTYQKLLGDTNTERERISATYAFNNPDNERFIKGFKGNIYSQYSKVNDNHDVTYTSHGTQTAESNKYYLNNDIKGGDAEFKSDFILLGLNHKLTYGIDYSDTSTKRLRNEAGTEKKDTPDTDIKRTGIYLQDEFSKGNFDFIAGVRFDNYELDAKNDSIYNNADFVKDLSEDNLSPKIAATYNFNDKFSSYAQYSQGFRAPAYYEVNSGFKNWIGGYTTESNPKLKPEISDSYEVGIRGRFKKIDLKLSAFYNDYQNFIERLKKTDNTSTELGFNPQTNAMENKALDIYKTQNTESAEIKGIEFSGSYYFRPNRYGLNLSTNIAFAEGDNLTDKVPLTSVNPFEAKISLGFNSEDGKWNTNLSNTFVGSPRVKDNETNFIPNEYSVTDFTISYKPKSNYQFSLGIYNLFDERYYNYQDVSDKSPTLSNLTSFSQAGQHVKAGFKIKF